MLRERNVLKYIYSINKKNAIKYIYALNVKVESKVGPERLINPNV